MSTLQFLRQEILAKPDDVNLRLAYSDRLLEECHPDTPEQWEHQAQWAAIIRGMCEAGPKVKPYPSHIWGHFYLGWWADAVTGTHETALRVVDHEDEWRAEVGQLGMFKLTVRKGFIEHVQLRPWDWSWEHERLLKDWPIRSLAMIGDPDWRFNGKNLTVHVANGTIEYDRDLSYFNQNMVNPGLDGLFSDIARVVYASKWPKIKFEWDRDEQLDR